MERWGGFGRSWGGETVIRIYYMKKYFKCLKIVLSLHFCYSFFYQPCCKSNVRQIVCRPPSACLFITLTEATLCIPSNSPFLGAKLESVNTVPEPDPPSQLQYVALTLAPGGQPSDPKWQRYGSLRMLFMQRESLCAGYTATEPLVHSVAFTSIKQTNSKYFGLLWLDLKVQGKTHSSGVQTRLTL